VPGALNACYRPKTGTRFIRYTYGMPYALNLRCDNDSAYGIRQLWAECSVLEESPSMVERLYPPHLTLAVYDEVQRENLFAGLDAIAACLSCLSIRFDALGYFRAPDAIVLWASPVLEQDVIEAHAAIHSTIDPNLCRVNYRPGCWVPHCSLATAISVGREDEVRSVAERQIDPVYVTFDAVDCVSFTPVEVLQERRLRSI
jgi:2'-5' RNA ligase